MLINKACYYRTNNISNRIAHNWDGPKFFATIFGNPLRLINKDCVDDNITEAKIEIDHQVE